jgi:hypothetical protein
MNWLAARVRLRVRTFFEVLDLGFIFVSANHRTYLRLAAWLLLPAFALCAGAQALHLPWPLLWLLAITLGKVVEGAFIVAAGQLLFSENVPPKAVMAAFGQRFFPYLGASLQSALLLAVTGLVVLPLPFMAAMMLFNGEFCLLERASPNEGRARGARLTKGYSGRAFALAAAIAAGRLGFVLVAELLGQGLVATVLQLGRPIGELFEDGGSSYALAGYFAAIPWLAAIRFIGYIDLRTRQEGWDIQLRFSALLQHAAEAA